eukprot:6180854-Pleurochrysis_carterae.AAC.1
MQGSNELIINLAIYLEFSLKWEQVMTKGQKLAVPAGSVQPLVSELNLVRFVNSYQSPKIAKTEDAARTELHTSDQPPNLSGMQNSPKLRMQPEQKNIILITSSFVKHSKSPKLV